jgi:hypothetical protein
MTGPIHRAVFNGREVSATWFDAPFRPWSPRVYAICFTNDRDIVLVRPTPSLLVGQSIGSGGWAAGDRSTT